MKTARGGLFGIDLVPDLASWEEYQQKVSLQGRCGRHEVGGRLTLVETVRQDHPRALTVFEHEYIESRGRWRRRHRFALAFRTVGVREMQDQLDRVGFAVDAVLGDYDGAAWDDRAGAWLILARRR